MNNPTQRDLKLLDFLAKYEVLSSKLIRESVYPKSAATNFFRRIRQLEKSKFIKRLGPMSNHSYVWVLDDKGKSVCGIEGRELFINRANLEHDVIVAHVRMVLEQFKVAKNYKPESLLRKEAQFKNTYHWSREDTIIVPDGMFEGIIANEERLLSLEVELSFKNRRRYHDLFRRYHETHDPVYLVWYLVKTKSMGERLQSCWNKFHEDNPRYSRKIVFLFTEIDSFLADPSEATYQVGTEINKLNRIWPAFQKRNDHTNDQTQDLSVITPVIQKQDGEKCP